MDLFRRVGACAFRAPREQWGRGAQAAFAAGVSPGAPALALPFQGVRKMLVATAALIKPRGATPYTRVSVNGARTAGRIHELHKALFDFSGSHYTGRVPRRTLPAAACRGQYRGDQGTQEKNSA